MDLGSCRFYEGGEIPWTAMREYADEYDFDEDQRVILFDVIRNVDIWFLKEIQARADKKNGRSGTNRGNGGGQRKVLPIGQRS